MQAISPSLHFDYAKTQSTKEGITLGHRLFFSEGNFNLYMLLALGFLMCQHESQESRKVELWQLINPRVSETV
jgi:hypothetical protein